MHLNVETLIVTFQELGGLLGRYTNRDRQRDVVIAGGRPLTKADRDNFRIEEQQRISLQYFGLQNRVNIGFSGLNEIVSPDNLNSFRKELTRLDSLTDDEIDIEIRRDAKIRLETHPQKAR